MLDFIKWKLFPPTEFGSKGVKEMENTQTPSVRGLWVRAKLCFARQKAKNLASSWGTVKWKQPER